MIRISDLNKYFNKGRQNELHVLNGVSLEMPEKGMVAIFGQSGCGKTTLLNVIGGLDGFEGGMLTVENKSIAKEGDLVRNEYIGYIFQNYNLQKGESCFDNVADALRLCGMTDEDEIEERVMAALTNVGLERYRSRTPDTLSGGQQQRVAIARAIVKNPKIILADEPTGNLDEENTLMVMNLLRQIADDHLVVLVTHEANLVDYYCDTVIELKDGKVTGIRNNSVSASSYGARSKNDIYLGELERSELAGAGATVEYYGDALAEPVKLKIINSGGKLYVHIDTDKVQVIDETSEIKLREGVYVEQQAAKEENSKIDMSKLPPVKGTRFGRLFSFGSAVKSGYKFNFKNKKKGKNILSRCMCLFAVVVVLMSAIFGTSLGTLETIDESYNHNVFYVYTPDASVSARIHEAAKDSASGIDSIRLLYGIPSGDTNVKFRTGFFETFATTSYDGSFTTNAVYLDSALAKDCKLVAGTRDGLALEDILISTAVADSLLKLSTVGYIEEYRDLIGMVIPGTSVGGKSLRVAGIVDTDEPAVYLSEHAMAVYTMEYAGTKVIFGDEYGLSANDGEAVVIVNPENGNLGENIPAVGDTVKVHGVELEVARVIVASHSYNDWLKNNGIEKQDEQAYWSDLEPVPPTDADYEEILNEVAKLYTEIETYMMANQQYDIAAEYDRQKISDPELDKREFYVPYLSYEIDARLADKYHTYINLRNLYDNPDTRDDWYEQAKNQMVDNRRFEYKDYYYEEYDEYLFEYHEIFGYDDIGHWLAREKEGMQGYKYYHADQEYVAALNYKAEHGVYPDRGVSLDYDSVYKNVEKYQEEYNQYINEKNSYVYSSDRLSSCFIISPSDYIDISKHVGETHLIAQATNSRDMEIYRGSGSSDGGSKFIVEMVGGSSASGDVYTVIHSSDPDKTEAYLSAHFSDVTTDKSYAPAMISPSSIYEAKMAESGKTVVTGVVTMIAILAVMSVCMFFIMRSSLMNRIKEVGIYRAIGVSKKNLIFKFFIEAIVLTVLTVVIGHLVTSAFIMLCLGMSPMVATMLYYPVWLATLLMVLLCGLCVLCGTLPIVSLLRKTPSQILAKYDI